MFEEGGYKYRIFQGAKIIPEIAFLKCFDDRKKRWQKSVSNEDILY